MLKKERDKFKEELFLRRKFLYHMSRYYNIDFKLNKVLLCDIQEKLLVCDDIDLLYYYEYILDKILKSIMSKYLMSSFNYPQIPSPLKGKFPTIGEEGSILF